MIGSNTALVVQPTYDNITRLRIRYVQVANAGGATSVTPVVPSTVKAVSDPAFVVPVAGNVIIDDTLNTLVLGRTSLISFKVEIDGIDFTSAVVTTLTIEWPEEGGGSCNFQLAAENPFSSSIIDIDDTLNIKGTYTDDEGVQFEVQLFKGRVVEWSFDPDGNFMNVTGQDLSRDVSKQTDKLNQEILGVDPVITETVTATQNDRITVRNNVDENTDNPIFGIWLESDSSLSDNIAEQIDFIIENKRTIVALNPLGKITAGRNYIVRYAIPISAFAKPNSPKSDVVEQIAKLAGIVGIKMERKGKVEDEIVGVNIVANQELPLDIIRKIIVPQTWRAEFDEFGDLVIRREILKTPANADFTFDEGTIIEETLEINKNTDSVVNEQRVSGVAKNLGTSRRTT